MRRVYEDYDLQNNIALQQAQDAIEEVIELGNAVGNPQQNDPVLDQLAALNANPGGNFLLGFVNADGTIKWITLGTNLTLVGTTLNATGGSGGGIDTANSPLAGEFAKFTDPDTIEGRTVSEVKADLSLGNVDNTADGSKPVSTAQAAADSAVQAFAIQRGNHTGSQAQSTITDLTTDLAAKAPLADPALTGNPTAPNQAAGNSSTRIANTAFVMTAIANLVASSPGLLDTLDELAAALGDDPNFAATTATALGQKMVKSANLSDLANVVTARGNLGLGAVALLASIATANIDNNAVDNTKLADMATARIKGRTTAATGDPEDLTATQVTAMLDVFTTNLKGLVPSPGTPNTTDFLRRDGSWAVPPGSGGGSDPWTYVKLASDFTTSSASAVDITGLGFTPAANKDYIWESCLGLRSATATVNPRTGWAWATGLLDGVATIEQVSTATAKVMANGNIGAALLIAVGGIPNNTQSWIASCWGFLKTNGSPSGNARLQLASETAGTIVRAVAGSYIRYRELA